MKLEYFNIDSETRGNGPRVTLGFSFQGIMTAGLVQEIGRRIENFLMPLHTSAPVPVVEIKPWWEGPHENYISPEHVRAAAPLNTWMAQRIVKVLEGQSDEESTPVERELLAESLAVLASEGKKDNLEAIEPVPEPVAEAKPPIRRNRGKMLPPVEVPSAPVAGTPLRVRGKPVAVLYADTEPAGETPAAEPTPAPAPRRTRTPAPEAEPEITDIELAKAASEAAAVIPLAEVKALIAAMGVTTVNQIEGQEKRKEFLDVLRDAVLTEAGG